MSDRKPYVPGPADLAHVVKDGETWTLVLVKDLRHAPEVVWEALTDPVHLHAWAPFDASRNLGAIGSARLTWAGAQTPIEAHVSLAEPPHALEYSYGDRQMRWTLQAHGGGTRLTLWAAIDRGYIAMGAAGWHVAFDVLERLLAGMPIERIAGPAAMHFDGWKRLSAEYARKFES